MLAVQRQAFGRVAEQLGISPDDLPPLTETLRDLQRLPESGTAFFVAVVGDEVIGSVRGTERDGVVHIGRLVVADRWLRRGVATALMDALEARFSGARQLVLFTGAEARAPLALYEARGYTRTHTSRENGVELVWLSKTLR